MSPTEQDHPLPPTYDLIVIGSGPGGEGASMKAAKEGKSVLVIDDYRQVGGACTHLGTIPSKALRHAVQQVLQRGLTEHCTYPTLLARAQAVIESQVNLRKGFYHRNAATVVHGRARFVDPHCVAVTRPNGNVEHYSATAFIIATGSRPYHPPDVDFSHPRVLDSDTILTLQETPRTLTIYGAGVVGCEYASIFRRLGSKVNLINTRDQLLSFLDDEIIDALSYHLRELGVLLRHNEEYQQVEADPACVRVHMVSNKIISGDYLLWAQGRRGNSDDMGLEEIDVHCNSRGSIVVNSNYQSAQAHIYAVGDVVGHPSLASAAYDQGRFAATHLVHGHCAQRLALDIPTGIYTIPEISSVGATERDLTAQKIPYEVGHSLFKHLARAQITGESTGMLKILFHRESLAILGVHCFGAQASEIIHIGQAILAQPPPHNTLLYFVNTTFNYPTMAEAYRVAALNGLNRVAR